MSLGIPQPRFMGAVEWMNSTGGLMSFYGTFPRVSREDEWRAWFLSMMNNQSLHAISLPNPNQFKDWKSCAVRFYEAINALPYEATP